MIRKLQKEITSQADFINRRSFIKSTAMATAGLPLAGCEKSAPQPAAEASEDKLTDYDSIITYNNFYEFTTEKEQIGKLAADFKPEPWKVEVTGLVNKPRTFDLDNLHKKFEQQNRVYRMRCVEAWSMVIP